MDYEAGPVLVVLWIYAVFGVFFFEQVRYSFFPLPLFYGVIFYCKLPDNKKSLGEAANVVQAAMEYGRESIGEWLSKHRLLKFFLGLAYIVAWLPANIVLIVLFLIAIFCVKSIQLLDYEPN